MSDIEIVSKKNQEAEGKGLETHLREENVREQAKRARDLLQALQDELAEIDDIKDGLSFLDLKNDTLLSYMIDLCNIILRKIRSEQIEGHSSVERCVLYRVILEKIKAIDQRLAYQLNKLITMPDDATEEGHRLDVRNLDIELSGSDEDSAEGQESNNNDDDNEDDEADESEGSDGDDSEGEEGSDDAMETSAPPKPSGVYKPPKLRSIAYLDDKDKSTRRKNYNDFYQEDGEGDIVDESRRDRDDERTRYEEEHYTRLPDSPKRAKRKLKGKGKSGGGGGGPQRKRFRKRR